MYRMKFVYLVLLSAGILLSGGGSACVPLITAPDAVTVNWGLWSMTYFLNGGGISSNTIPVRINGQDIPDGGVITIGPGGTLVFDFGDWVGRPNVNEPFSIIIVRPDGTFCRCENCRRLECQVTVGGSYTISFTFIGKDGKPVTVSWTVIVVIDNGNSNPNPLPWGACCKTDGACEASRKFECDAIGGAWTQGSPCAPNPCPQPTGSCCHATNGSCVMLEKVPCEAQGGGWTPNRPCAPNPCLVYNPTGSCTLPDGQCEISTASSCNGGTFVDGGACPPKGACCVGACLTVNQAYCASLGGAWVGGSCTANTCSPPPPPTGACCENNACSVKTQANCAGVWTQGVQCSAVNCGSPVQLVASIVSITPMGGNYTLTNPVTTLNFAVKVNITGGDGRTLVVHCLPYTTTGGNGTHIDVQFTATNGEQIVNVPVKLAAVTNAGNNYFWVYDEQDQISAGHAVTITVH